MKKWICLTIAIVMIFSSFCFSFADEQESDSSLSATTGIPEELDGLDEYLSLLFNGTIYFDEDAAVEDGYSDLAVAFVRGNILKMNELLTSKRGYSAHVDSDFNLIILGSNNRANGETKIVSTWYGVTQIYMNSDEAQLLYDTIGSYGNTVGNIAGLIPTIGTWMSYYVSATTWLYRYQIQQAMSAGTGIIMNIYIDPVTTAESIWFTAQ